MMFEMNLDMHGRPVSSTDLPPPPPPSLRPRLRSMHKLEILFVLIPALLSRKSSNNYKCTSNVTTCSYCIYIKVWQYRYFTSYGVHELAGLEVQSWCVVCGVIFLLFDMMDRHTCSAAGSLCRHMVADPAPLTR